MNRVDIFLQGNLLGRIGHGDIGKPLKIGFGPLRTTGEDDPVSEQKSLESLLCFFSNHHGIFPGSAQIAHGFVLSIGDINGSQFIGTVQSGQHFSIPAVIFDTVTALFRD